MEAELHAIGIDLDPMPDPVREIFRYRMRGYSDTGGFELTALYVDPSGAKVAVGRSERGSYVDAGLVGRHASPAEVFRVTDSLAHVDLMDRDGELSTRILAYVDDPVMYPWYPLKAVGETRRLDVTIGALGTEVEVFSDLEAYLASQDVPGRNGRFGPHVISPWMFALYAGDATAEEANGAAMFGAVCRELERRTNRLTGQDFWYIDADAGFPLTAAVAIDQART